MKRQMRYSFDRVLAQPCAVYGELVSISEVALSDLAALFLDAYLDTIDYEGETIEDAREELANLLGGAYGPVIREASMCVRVDDDLASAIFVTNREGVPFIAYMVTGKRHMRRGFARTLLLYASGVLHDLGHEEVRLGVTKGNVAAEQLYESLGFEDIQGSV